MRTTFKREQDVSQRLEDQRSKIGMGGTNNPHLGASNNLRMVHEAMKRREEISRFQTIKSS